MTPEQSVSARTFVASLRVCKIASSATRTHTRGRASANTTVGGKEAAESSASLSAAAHPACRAGVTRIHGSRRIAITRRLSRAGEPRRPDSHPKTAVPASNNNKPEAAEARRRREQDHSTAAEPLHRRAAVLRVDRPQRRQPRLLRHQLGPEHWTSPCKHQAPLKL